LDEQHEEYCQCDGFDYFAGERAAVGKGHDVGSAPPESFKYISEDSW